MINEEIDKCMNKIEKETDIQISFVLTKGFLCRYEVLNILSPFNSPYYLQIYM